MRAQVNAIVLGAFEPELGKPAGDPLADLFTDAPKAGPAQPERGQHPLEQRDALTVLHRGYPLGGFGGGRAARALDDLRVDEIRPLPRRADDPSAGRKARRDAELLLRRRTGAFLVGCADDDRNSVRTREPATIAEIPYSPTNADKQKSPDNGPAAKEAQ